ncbi:MAG: rod shape-determining protein RodA [Candidatus Krumholzibacteriota bacterium]|nr:rod shape-determining protein RodA [Candidatus Krumholzibacteriota bacterium]
MNSKFVENIDWILIVVTLVLIGSGLLNLYSIGYIPADLQDTMASGESHFFEKQSLWALLGVVVLILGVLIPFKYYEVMSYPIYFVSLALLLFVLFFDPSRGSSRWITIGGMRLQPSEIMKIAAIFLLAKYLSAKGKDPNRLRVIAVAVMIIAVPFFIIIKQPDLGTALVFPALLLPVLYWRGLDEGIMLLFITPVVSAFLTVYSESSLSSGDYPFPLLVFFLIILVIAYRRRHRIFQSIMLVGINLFVMLTVPGIIGRLEIYQQKRILAFFRPESDILGMGWQVYQSKLAIGSGGFTGKGFLEGTQKMLEFLPERHSDFVFSVLSEELGFIGSVVIIGLFGIMIYRILFLAVKTKSRFGSLAAVGISAYFIFHCVINIGMTIGLAPVTGLPLPLISYGGSSMLTSCFLIGVALNFGMRFNEY